MTSTPPSSDTTSNTDKPSAIFLNTGDNNTTPPFAQATNSKLPLLWTAGSLLFLGFIIGADEAYARRQTAKATFRRYLRSITVQPLKR
jgi:hypothetical protein